MPLEELRRGCVFGADHDTTLEFWVADPKWKRCLLFNASPPGEADNAHYFFATASGVGFFQQHTNLMSDVLILPANSYPFFPKETALDFREVHVVPMKKLREMNLRVLGHLSAADIARCEVGANSACQLVNDDKRMLALRN